MQKILTFSITAKENEPTAYVMAFWMMVRSKNDRISLVVAYCL